jgi:hypothetical protein
MNGNGQNALSNNKNYLVGARIDIPIVGTYKMTESDIDYSETPNVGIGLAYALNRASIARQGGAVPAGVKTSNGTFDLGLKYRGFSVQAAGMITRTHGGNAQTNWGYFGQTGYFIVPKHFEVAARAGGIILPNAPNQYEYTAALNYFINGHALKIQGDYSLLQNARAQGTLDHRARLQFQVIF